MTSELVRAAGGVVWRRHGDDVEILLVHRSRYDDWSLPKGKNEPGEDDLTCARREIEEETGLRCVPGAELARRDYVDHRGRHKVVRYWAMAAPDDAEPIGDGEEVDVLAWMAATDAIGWASYLGDREVIAGFVAGLVAPR